MGVDRPLLGLILIAAVAGLVACATPGGDGASASDAPSEEETAMPIRQVPADILEAALAAAGDREDLLRDHFEIRVAEPVTWSDGSLGCPQPERMYTQALVPGYRFVLEYAGGREMHVHASQSGDVVVCDDPQPPVGDGPVDR